jgi:tRNA/tmRNA/rRNA uracil-C5-methylase (TrmA/RlmC/RlmD family)
VNLIVGSQHEVEIQRVAHGGHCVGRIGEVVCFVRHALPGEKVKVEITSIGKQNKFVFADVVEVIEASEHRITPKCEYAGICGGCDWQHSDFGFQQEMKTEILKEQLVRLGKLSPTNPLLMSLKVKPLPGDQTGLGYRTRVEYLTDSRGRLGFRKQGSNQVVSVKTCVVARDEITGDGFTNVPWAPEMEIRVVVSASGEIVKIAENDNAEYRVTEKVDSFSYQLNANSFWQAHTDAPKIFVDTAIEMLDLKPGQHVCDLYSGSGLFTLPFSAAVGAGGRVESVESDLKAVSSLKRNTRSFSNVNIYAMGIEKWFATSRLKKVDAVLLDPPRAGAGRKVIQSIVQLSPSKVLYVACDPASLGRDVGYFSEYGYELSEIRAWDAFGQTQHLETFALFTPSKIRSDSAISLE